MKHALLLKRILPLKRILLLKRFLPLALVAFSLGLAVPVRAQTSELLGIRASASNSDAQFELSYRHRFAGGVQLGLATGAAHARQAYVAGFASTDQPVGRLGVVTRFPLLRRPDLQFHFGLDVGVRRIFGDDGQPIDSSGSWAIEAQASLLGAARVGAGALSFGVLIPFSMEVAPEVINDVQGALILLGAAWPLSERVWIHGDFETGGVFGADGDAQKFLIRGSLGLRVLLGSGTESSTDSWWAF